jgi:hypothetical protein
MGKAMYGLHKMWETYRRGDAKIPGIVKKILFKIVVQV